jgi:prepilin-type processing-associated H-X9-DG protein
MSDSDLIGYLIGALSPHERRGVEAALNQNPSAMTRLEHLRAKLLPLEAERDPVAPPLALAERTVRRLEMYLCSLEHEMSSPSGHVSSGTTVETAVKEPLPSGASLAESAAPFGAQKTGSAYRDGPETRTVGGRFRPDLLVACGIALFAFGLVLTAVGKARAHYQMLACQKNLQDLHAALTGYAETHDGQYPLVGRDATADSFAATLVEAGQLPPDYKVGCPVSTADEPTNPVQYTYSLGFQTTTGQLLGLRREDKTNTSYDLMPIAADFPTAPAAPFSGPVCAHAPWMNVLFVGGHVRCTNSALIGPNGDDIYRNVNGQVAAGLGFSDAVLGRPGDKP